MVAFLSGHLSILVMFRVELILFFDRSRVIDPAGILPVADFNRTIIAAYLNEHLLFSICSERYFD
jgi:hypothetical protein